MKNILIIGAGRSATDLILYLLKHAAKQNWKIVVADYNLPLAEEKVGSHPNGTAVFFDANDTENRRKRVSETDLVVSFLPAHMHMLVARDCLEFGVHLVTASYVNAELQAMDQSVKDKGLTFLCELGADPGIDHMSALRSIDAIKDKGGKLLAFKSYCGALIDPKSDDNPWGYKFTWSPMNLIVAGQGTAQYIEDGRYQYIPYHRLFSTTEMIEIPGYGQFEAYANRDSLAYRKQYNLEDLPTMFRATLRRPGFCEAWNALVKLGITDKNYKVKGSASMRYADWIRAYLPHVNGQGLEQAVANYLDTSVDSPLMDRLRWIELFSDRQIERKDGTPAEILLDLLLDKFQFRESDRDMLVMLDYFEYEWEGKLYEKRASLVSIGLDPVHTAISRTVGLPAAIGARLILEGKIQRRGVMIPVAREIYEPILDELSELGIRFEEVEQEIPA